MKNTTKHFPGFTLIELLVVVGILAALTALVLPKLDGLQGNANHAVGAASADDTGRFIQIYKSTKNRLPDGWDSLIDPVTNELWAPANPSTTPVTRGLHSELSAAATGKLTKSNLTANQVASLQAAGIYTLYDLGGPGVTSTTRPGDMFNVPVAIAEDTPVAFVSTTNGKKIIDHIYRDNLKAGGTSGKIGDGTKVLVAFGFGPHNAMIGKTMLEVPSYPNVDATLIYGRNLVIFEIPIGTSTSTARAVFKAVVGADGDLIDDMAASLNKDAN